MSFYFSILDWMNLIITLHTKERGRMKYINIASIIQCQNADHIHGQLVVQALYSGDMLWRKNTMVAKRSM